mgnify:CR=1 FL=1
MHLAHRVYQQPSVVGCVQNSQHRVPHRLWGLQYQVPNTSFWSDVTRVDKSSDWGVQQTILWLFLLLLSVEKSVQGLTIESLSDRIPPQSCDRNLHILLLFDLLITILEWCIRTVQSHLEHGGRVLCNSKSTQAAPELNVKFQFNLLQLGWNP